MGTDHSPQASEPAVLNACCASRQDQLSDHPERFFVSEIVREKLFLQYEQEIPYGCQVRALCHVCCMAIGRDAWCGGSLTAAAGCGAQVNVVEFKERPGKKDFVSVHIIVERDGHRGILLGKGGSAIKQLATTARMDVEEFLQRPVREPPLLLQLAILPRCRCSCVGAWRGEAEAAGVRHGRCTWRCL